MHREARVTVCDVESFWVAIFEFLFLPKHFYRVILEVTCHSAPLPLLDLIPVGHMVAFTKRVLIKAELSKTKLLIVGF